MDQIKIASADLAGKGVVGLADAPGLSTAAMQAKFDEIALDVLVPKHNALIDLFASADGAAAIGAQTGTVADHIAAGNNPHGVTAAQVGAYTKAETDVQIAARITDIGSADMTRAVYDGNNNGVVDDSERLGGHTPSYYAPATDAIALYTHSKTGATHFLTGSGDNIKFVAAADFSDRDAIVVNGTTCLALTCDGQPLSGGSFVQGTVVGCFKNGATLNFKQGGAGLNYKVIAVADEQSLPATAVESTIAVITTVKITEHQFKATMPTARADGSALIGGEVWIESRSASLIPINVTKQNAAFVYPTGVQQYSGGAFVKKECRVYKNGAWMTLYDIYFSGGNERTAYTGGWSKAAIFSGQYNLLTVTNTGGKLVVSGTDGGFATNNPVDLTNVRRIRVRLTCSKSLANNNAFLCASTTRNNMQSAAAFYLVPVTATETEYQFDTTSLTGNYYVGGYFSVAAGQSSSFAISMYIGDY